MELTYFIELLNELQMDNSYILSLDRLLRFHDVETIIDVAGGTGFPILQLRKLGWNATYADGDKQMVDYFVQKLKASALRIPYFHADWLTLNQQCEQTFDFVLCRGNSLIYVDSWGVNRIHEATYANIKKSLHVFFQTLNKGGILYVDMYKKDSERRTRPSRVGVEERGAFGKKVSFSWIGTQDEVTRLRSLTITLQVDGQREELTFHSYFLKHKELVDLLYEVGFARVEEIRLDGENIFTPYLAFKS